MGEKWIKKVFAKFLENLGSSKHVLSMGNHFVCLMGFGL